MVYVGTNVGGSYGPCKDKEPGLDTQFKCSGSNVRDQYGFVIRNLKYDAYLDPLCLKDGPIRRRCCCVTC